MKIYEMGKGEERRTGELTEVWERSVKATHSFLPDTVREELKKIVQGLLAEVPHLVAAEDDRGALTGFMGIDGRRNWKCCSLRRRRADRGWDGSCWNMAFRHLEFLSLG